jgi:hypothetical protein
LNRGVTEILFFSASMQTVFSICDYGPVVLAEYFLGINELACEFINKSICFLNKLNLFFNGFLVL